MQKPVFILSIDGGGIYGIVSALILSEIENQTKKPISQLFDLVAGTSTGGLIALGLSMPDRNSQPAYSALDTAKLYEEHNKEIFNRPFLHRIKALGNILDEKYPPKGVKKALNNFFKDTLLSELLVPTLITAYEIKERQTYMFKSIKALFDKEKNFFIKDIAQATSAAPSYFEPAHFQNITKTKTLTCIDGGIFANNPSMCAYVEARSLFPDSTIKLISVGAEWPRESYPYNKAKKWGVLKWVGPIVDSTFDGQGDVTDYQLNSLFTKDSSTGDEYFRISPQLPTQKNGIALDDASDENIKKVKKLATDYIEENKKMISDISKLLLQNL